MIFMLLY